MDDTRSGEPPLVLLGKEVTWCKYLMDDPRPGTHPVSVTQTDLGYRTSLPLAQPSTLSLRRSRRVGWTVVLGEGSWGAFTYGRRRVGGGTHPSRTEGTHHSVASYCFDRKGRESGTRPSFLVGN